MPMVRNTSPSTTMFLKEKPERWPGAPEVMRIMSGAECIECIVGSTVDCSEYCGPRAVAVIFGVLDVDDGRVLHTTRGGGSSVCAAGGV
jgi:hypothetical protein